MTETPSCPYCGKKMALKVREEPKSKWNARYVCNKCHSTGPYANECQEKSYAEEVALAYTLHRAEPENRPLTLGEVQECCEKGIGYMPLWVEFRNSPNVSCWMPINLPGIVFSGETVSIYLKSIGDKYNVMWRCWHWKPMPWQMAAATWEE